MRDVREFISTKNIMPPPLFFGFQNIHFHPFFPTRFLENLVSRSHFTYSFKKKSARSTRQISFLHTRSKKWTINEICRNLRFPLGNRQNFPRRPTNPVVSCLLKKKTKRFTHQIQFLHSRFYFLVEVKTRFYLLGFFSSGWTRTRFQKRVGGGIISFLYSYRQAEIKT